MSQVEEYRNEGFQHEEASPEHQSATSSEHGMSAFGDTASMSVGEPGDVSTLLATSGTCTFGNSVAFPKGIYLFTWWNQEILAQCGKLGTANCSLCFETITAFKT